MKIINFNGKETNWYMQDLDAYNSKFLKWIIADLQSKTDNEVYWLESFREFLLHFIQGEKFEDEIFNEIDIRLIEIKEKK